MPFIIILLVVVAVVIFRNIIIVPQGSEYVVEILGKYSNTWDAGLHIKVPLISKVVNKVSIKEQVLDSAPQPVITKDNVTMQIDTVVYFTIFNAFDFTYGVFNPLVALENLTATTLRNIVGDMELDATLSGRDVINGKMTHLLDEATDKWGIKVNRVELKNIMPPREIQNAMEKQMKAERERRETLLQAEGHKQAVITRAEGDKKAAILKAEGERDARIALAEGEAKALRLARQAESDGLRMLRDANPTPAVLELKKYEALIALSNGQAAKLIVPTNAVEMVSKGVMFTESTGLGNAVEPAPAVTKEAEQDHCCDDDALKKLAYEPNKLD